MTQYNMLSVDHYRVHLKSHRLMRIAFLLYEKAMPIVYAYLFSFSQKAMRISLRDFR